MAEIAYNNVRNISTSYTPFELNCGYHFRVSFKKNVDSHSKSKVVDELIAKFKVLMSMYKENLYDTQELQ